MAGIARDVLFFLRHASLRALLECDDDSIRNTTISQLEKCCATPRSMLQAMDIANLGAALLVESILHRSQHQELHLKSVDDQRNTLIVANNRKLGHAIPKLQSLSSLENCRLAYDWLIPELAAPMLRGIEDTKAGVATFQTVATLSSSERKVGMDVACVRFFQGQYIAVFHTLRPGCKDQFDLHLAIGGASLESADWKEVALLSHNASMGQFYFIGSGVVLLFEQNTPSYGPSVAVYTYACYSDFLSGAEPSSRFVSERSLSHFAEGTPSLISWEEVERKVTMTIGLHYYKDGRRDLQAVAVLQKFDTQVLKWETMPLTVSTDWMDRNGFRGKIGSRSSFWWAERCWFLMEAQKVLNDWHSWRVVLGDGIGFIEVGMRTPKDSTSFANPFITTFRKGEHSSCEFCLNTLFIPSEGAGEGEVGELLHEFLLPSVPDRQHNME